MKIIKWFLGAMVLIASTTHAADMTISVKPTMPRPFDEGPSDRTFVRCDNSDPTQWLTVCFQRGYVSAIKIHEEATPLHNLVTADPRGASARRGLLAPQYCQQLILTALGEPACMLTEPEELDAGGGKEWLSQYSEVVRYVAGFTGESRTVEATRDETQKIKSLMGCLRAVVAADWAPGEYFARKRK